MLQIYSSHVQFKSYGILPEENVVMFQIYTNFVLFFYELSEWEQEPPQQHQYFVKRRKNFATLPY
jgi:hypothetical protein